MISSNRALALAVVSLSALVAASSAANAGAFGIREQSATAQGTSFAGAASGVGGLSSMFWNPAAVTMKPGWNSEYHASFIIPEARITPGPGTSPFLASPPLSGNFIGSGDIGQEAVVPASYSSYQLNDMLWVGMSSTSPFALTTKPEPIWSGQIYARTSKILSFNFNPIVGIKITDWLSFAAGPVIQYFDVSLKSATSFAAGASTLELEADDVAMGATAGVMLTLPTQTQIGVGFRSSINHELDGKLRNPGGFPSALPIEASLNLPEMLNVGISQAITPYFRVHAAFEWANWSRLQEPAIIGPTGVAVASLPLKYDDGFFYAVGAEYDFNESWTVRAGLAFEESPITDANRTPRLPDNDRIWASIGATYKWSDKLSFDVAYTHIFIDDTKINIVEGHPSLVSGTVPGVGAVSFPFVADVDSNVNIISAALKYRWDDPKVAVPAAPIVRKY
jgi:long-chain fatty acid transport protein